MPGPFWPVQNVRALFEPEALVDERQTGLHLEIFVIGEAERLADLGEAVSFVKTLQLRLRVQIDAGKTFALAKMDQEL